MNNTQKVNLATQAHDIITKKIINAEYKPGEKISEKNIEADIGIGRTPVREAILQLRQEHLIKVIPQSGTYISKIDMKEVLDARFIRASVEQRIMRNATTINLTDEQLINFEQILERQYLILKENNFAEFLKNDNEFHRYFYVITDHLRIWNWLKRINIQFDRFRFLRLRVEGLSWTSLIDDHNALLKSVRNHDVNEVERLTANHMHRMLIEEPSLTKKFPNYFIND